MTILMLINALLLMAIAAYMVGMYKTTAALSEVVDALKRRVELIATDTIETKKEVRDTLDFSLKTVQQARRIYRQASEIAGQPQLHIDGDAFIQQVKEKIEEDSNDEQ